MRTRARKSEAAGDSRRLLATGPKSSPLPTGTNFFTRSRRKVSLPLKISSRYEQNEPGQTNIGKPSPIPDSSFVQLKIYRQAIVRCNQLPFSTDLHPHIR